MTMLLARMGSDGRISEDHKTIKTFWPPVSVLTPTSAGGKASTFVKTLSSEMLLVWLRVRIAQGLVFKIDGRGIGVSAGTKFRLRLLCNYSCVMCMNGHIKAVPIVEWAFVNRHCFSPGSQACSMLLEKVHNIIISSLPGTLGLPVTTGRAIPGGDLISPFYRDVRLNPYGKSAMFKMRVKGKATIQWVRVEGKRIWYRLQCAARMSQQKDKTEIRKATLVARVIAQRHVRTLVRGEGDEGWERSRGSGEGYNNSDVKLVKGNLIILYKPSQK
ncbi:hypothetical protein EV424DRAFT_1348393 [Suillus variegatus]|nr:hypothetical protein EV424DRAFT_1348393 [Suillus variegatus]